MRLHPDSFVHPCAFICGDVTLAARVSVWPMAVVRGDTAPITIGPDSNIQDGTIVHVDHGVPTVIGARVAVGHRAILHGCTVGDDCLIAMGAVVLNRVEVGSGSIIAAGAVCTEGMKIPPNSLVMGVPARVVRETTPEMRERIARTVASSSIFRTVIGGANSRADPVIPLRASCAPPPTCHPASAALCAAMSGSCRPHSWRGPLARDVLAGKRSLATFSALPQLVLKAARFRERFGQVKLFEWKEIRDCLTAVLF